MTGTRASGRAGRQSYQRRRQTAKVTERPRWFKDRQRRHPTLTRRFIRTRFEAMIGPIVKKDIPAFSAVALTTRGPYWKLSDVFARLRARLAEAGLKPTGMPLGLFYDDPAGVPPSETRYSICYPIDGALSSTAQRALGVADALRAADAAACTPPSGDVISLLEFPAAVAAVVEYEGPAADSPTVYEHLRSWIERTASVAQGAPRELYLAEPGTLGRGLMHVEVQQPLAGVTAREG